MRQPKTDIRRPRRTVIRDYPYAPGGRLAFAAQYRKKRYALCDWRKREARDGQ